MIYMYASYAYVFRVPTVMESHGEKKLSWKVMEKSWKLKKINKVMETEKS